MIKTIFGCIILEFNIYFLIEIFRLQLPKYQQNYLFSTYNRRVLKNVPWHELPKMPMVHYKTSYVLQNYIESWNEKLAALKMLNNAIKQKLTTCYHNGYPFIFFFVIVHKLLSYKIILHYSIFLHTCFTNNLVIYFLWHFCPKNIMYHQEQIMLSFLYFYIAISFQQL